MGFLKLHGHQLVDLGYKIVPLKKANKMPLLRGWQDIRATHEDVDKWLGNGHRDGGVGVLCIETIAVDIDCLDANLNRKLISWIDQNVGETCVRVGQAPKCILPFRCDEPFSKIRSSEFEDEMGSKHAVEILGKGQQFVAYGVHPATQKPYRWTRGKALADTAQADLPTITREQAQLFVEHFELLASKMRGWTLARKGVASIDFDDDDLSGFRAKMEVDEAGVEQLLAAVDPDCHHDEWVKVGMALHHHFDGDPVGQKMWDDWSSGGSKYQDFECERRYQSFGNGGGAKVTLASVKAIAKEALDVEVVEERLPHMLQEWAFVQVEGSARVIREDLNRESLVLYKLDDLKKEHMNCRVLSTDVKPKLINLVDMWLESPTRRTYAAGLTFAPESQILGKYNLWRGWSHTPTPGDVEPWLDFVQTVIANGDADHARYIIAWAAHLIQQPMQKIGIGLVLRGAKGTGKTKFGEFLGGLFAGHHMIVSRAEQITGNFNRHLEDTLLLQGDEAYWAGAKASESALKDLLTNSKISIERKGVDVVTMPNYTRVLFTSNEDYVIPASLDERRFAVFDVSNVQKQNSKYFHSLDIWYEKGGAGALLDYLMHFDIENINLRLIPATDALLDQKMHSLDNVDAWLHNALQSGEIRENRVAGLVLSFGGYVSKAELYDIYVSRVSGRYDVPLKENAFWRRLKKQYQQIFGAEVQRVVAGQRSRHIELNTLDASRFIYSAISGLDIEWLDADEGDSDDPFNPTNWEQA